MYFHDQKTGVYSEEDNGTKEAKNPGYLFGFAGAPLVSSTPPYQVPGT
jgi:hypothetical protein